MHYATRREGQPTRTADGISQSGDTSKSGLAGTPGMGEAAVRKEEDMRGSLGSKMEQEKYRIVTAEVRLPRFVVHLDVERQIVVGSPGPRNHNWNI